MSDPPKKKVYRNKYTLVTIDGVSDAKLLKIKTSVFCNRTITCAAKKAASKIFREILPDHTTIGRFIMLNKKNGKMIAYTATKEAINVSSIKDRNGKAVTFSFKVNVKSLGSFAAATIKVDTTEGISQRPTQDLSPLPADEKKSLS